MREQKRYAVVLKNETTAPEFKNGNSIYEELHHHLLVSGLDK